MSGGVSVQAGLAWLSRVLCLLALVWVELYSKLYQGPGANWINHSLGGIFYVIFWCAFWDLVRPNTPEKIIAVTVLVVTSVLEFLQLSQHPILIAVRATFVGRTLLGTTFVASDFFYYVIGSVLGYFWVRWVRVHNPRSANAYSRK